MSRKPDARKRSEAQKQEAQKQQDQKLDEALEASFPASDPVSFTVSQPEEEDSGAPRRKRDRESRTSQPKPG